VTENRKSKRARLWSADCQSNGPLHLAWATILSAKLSLRHRYNHCGTITLICILLMCDFAVIEQGPRIVDPAMPPDELLRRFHERCYSDASE